MARYKEKDKTDLVWNRIRRRITRELDTEIQNAREEALNDLLAPAWREYLEARGKNKLREVEGKYTNLVTTIVADIVQPVKIEGADDSPVD